MKKYALFQTILFFGKCDQTENITSGVCRITGTALNNTVMVYLNYESSAGRSLWFFWLNFDFVNDWCIHVDEWQVNSEVW